MKNFDSVERHHLRPWVSLELTCVPPLWNHPKTVGVAQALVPVRFSGIVSRCSNQYRVFIARLVRVS